MPDAVGRAHGLGLVDASDAAALADHDAPETRAASRLPGRQIRDCGRGGAGGRDPRAEHDARGTDAVRAAIAPASRRPGATTAPRRVAPVVPPTDVTHGEAWAAYAAGAAVAGRGDHDDVGLGRAEQRAFDGVEPPTVGGAVDGEVEHVDAVGDGPVDRRDQVGGRAAVVARVGGGPARLVDGEPGLGRGAGVQAGALTRHLDADAGVAGGDRGHQGAVAVVVERGEAGGAAHPVGAEAVDEPLRADDLAVAHPRRPSRVRSRSGRGSRAPTGPGRARRRTAGCRARGRSRRARSTTPAPPRRG